MLPDELMDQEFAVRILTGHRERGKLAHTYLFTGGSIETQKRLAGAFAVYLNDSPDAVFGASESAAAKKVKAGNHPDVRWIGEDEKLRSLKIEEVRDIIGWVSLRPYEGEWKVLIVCQAERLTVEAQNALLKTLEEPPAHTVFCLLVQNKDHVLETIKSRSFEIRLRPEKTQSPDAGGAAADFGKKRWEDFFEDYQAAPRDQVFELMDFLMERFRGLLAEGSARRLSGIRPQAWLAAVEAVYETKAALDGNANQKLALTRLAMKMKQLVPTAQLLKVD